MALTRKRVILAKIESTYGVDPTPTGTANAIAVKDLTVTPIEAEKVSRDLIRPFLGNSEELLTQYYSKVEFTVEAVGSGTIGLAPAYDQLLRACGLTKASPTVSLVITQVANVATATTVAAHGLAVGDKVVITGATQGAYNGTMTVLSVPTSTTFTYAVIGAPASPATGSPVMGTSIVYSPVSTAFESLTLYFFNDDNILHKITGAFGTFTFDLAVKTIPSLKFSFTGIFNTPASTALPATDFSSWMIPQVANTQNTPSYSLFGYSASGMESVSIDMAVDVQYITLVGSQKVRILDRKPNGTIVFEAPTIGTKDFFSLVAANTKGAFLLNHGSVNGYKFNVSCPYVLMGNPSYTDSNGVQMLSAPFSVVPGAAGNDEISITVA